MNDKIWRKNQSGSAIIYVMFIMLITMVLTTTVAGIMLRNIKITKGYSQSARSYYASESGVERGLYYLQWARNQKNVGAQTAAATIANFSATFASQARYANDTSVTDDDFSATLDQYQSQQWDIFSEDNISGYHLKPLPDLKNIAIQWNESSSCATGTSQVEVSVSTWTQFAWEDISDLDTRSIVLCPTAGNGYDCYDYQLGADSTHLYRVRLKALKCDIENATVQPLNSAGKVIPTYNLVQLSSTGNYLDTQRSVAAQTLWHPPLQHYFDFVLFSEDKITK